MKTILLDRDGVLNPYIPEGYVQSPAQWQWQKNAIIALQKLAKQDYRIIIITNQSCINRKMVSYQTVSAIHSFIKATLAEVGVTNIHFAICHHISEDLCQCRKPKTENIKKIIDTYRLAKEDIIFIGDSPSDMEAGQNAGVKTIALKTGNSKMEMYLQQSNLKYYEDLDSAIKAILD
jgi:D-glycero-D-manno-heptose 1,7-bisphosphate phosphatase